MNENAKQTIRSAAREVRKGVAAMDSRSGLVRADGWQNLFTGVGTALDKRIQTTFATAERLSWQMLEELYVGDGMARRIVDMPTKEMTRKGFEIEGDTDGKILREMKNRGLLVGIREMLRWSKLYGGALGVLEVDDGAASLAKPLRENRIRGIHGMQVYNRWRTWWTPADLYQDPADPKYMTPQWYTVSPILSTPFRVHESRTVRMDGLPVPDTQRVRNLGWGDSILQAVYDKLRALFSVYAAGETIVDDFVTGAMSVKNLSNMLQTDAGVRTVRDRINTIDMSKHILNTIMMDADLESFEKHASSVSGLSDLFDRYAQMVSAVTGMPITLLMGRSPAGMNATGDSDFQGWYDVMASDQEDVMAPAIHRLVSLLSMAKESNTSLPAEWDVKFKPLWQLSEPEEAKRRYAIAQADAIYLKMGLTPGEILQSRFGGGRFSAETRLDPTIKPEDRKAMPIGKPGVDGEDPDDADEGKKGKARK